MKLKNNSILITGGSSGLGLEMAKVFSEKGNKVIICGRTANKLNYAKELIPNLIIYQCDLSNVQEIEKLSQLIKKGHQDLNILINNAAIVHKSQFKEDPEIMKKLKSEIQTNLIAPIGLINQLLPVLEKNSNPEVINITTGLIYAPRALYPFYNATKAALHSFTQVLRFQMMEKKTKITEVMFPAVDTPLHQGSPPKIAISVEKAVQEMIDGLMKEKDEIRVGGAKILYKVSRIAPSFAFKKVNSL